MSDWNTPGFRVDQHDDYTTIRFRHTQLTETVINDIVGPKLNDLLDRLQPTKVVFNLEAVEYLSSAALRELLMVHHNLKQRRGSLSLCRLQPQIQSIFRVSRLDEVFRITEDFRVAMI